MKKTLLFLILSNFSLIVFSQYYFGIQAGATHPLTTYETTRKFGAELGVNFGKKIYNQIYFETGLNLEAYIKNKNLINPILRQDVNVPTSNTYMYTIDGSYKTFSIQIPLLLSSTFKDDRFQVNTGFLLSGRNILTLSKNSGADPEISSPTYANATDGVYPGIRQYGFDFHLGFALKIYKELRLYLNYRTPINNLFIDDGMYSIGLKYNLIDRKL